MMNDLTVTQVSTVLNDIVKQATGLSDLKGVDTSNFVAVAQIGLQSGYDNIMGAISQTLAKTVFSVRPYTAKFKSLNVDNIKWGNHVRKLRVLDKDFEDNAEWEAKDGQSIDMQKINAPKVLQTNFFGQETYSKSLTTYKDQLDVAFSSAEEFARFVSMSLQNVSDMIEQAHETTARTCLANMIYGSVKVDLLAEYNRVKGASLKYADIFKKDNFTDFFEFAYATIRAYSNLMTERSVMYHNNITGKEVTTHTPYSKQKMFALNTYDEYVKSTVLSSVYNDKYLTQLNFEQVNFWQSIKNPDTIMGQFTTMNSNGELVKSEETQLKNIFAILFDEEACGYSTFNQWSASSPFNAKGGYTNTHWHFTERYWNDFTENSIVFTLGE